jgi:hypothetical protein
MFSNAQLVQVEVRLILGLEHIHCGREDAVELRRPGRLHEQRENICELLANVRAGTVEQLLEELLLNLGGLGPDLVL